MDYDQLSKIKKTIIYSYITKFPDKPLRFKSYDCLEIDLTKFDKKEIEVALDSLIDIGFLVKENGNVFIMPQDVFRSAKKKYIKIIWLKKSIAKLKQFFFSRFITGLISGVVVGVILMYLKSKYW